MDCPACGAPALVVSTPNHLREYLPGDPEIVSVCRRCLTTAPLDDGAATDDPAAVSELSTALPDDPETTLETALLVTLCESLALNRTEIEELVSRIERAGTDPLSTLDRLANDPAFDLALDVERRRPQLVQLLE